MAKDEIRPVTTVFPVRVEAPWNAYLISVTRFPAPAAEASQLSDFLDRLLGPLRSPVQFASEVFIQLEQLPGKEAHTAFSDHAREWLPETGLGVWPDREPPAIWTQEEFMNLTPGDKLRPLMFQLFRITTPPAARLKAWRVMLGFGSILEIMVEGSAKSFFEATRSTFLQKIQDRSYRAFPFYAPLLERKTIENASSDDLQQWCGAASVYIRESFEDQGILILSRRPLDHLFEGWVATRQTGAQKYWQYPR